MPRTKKGNIVIAASSAPPLTIEDKLCARLGCSIEAILSYTVYDDYVSVVVNRGIAGCPKYSVPLAELEEGGKP